MLQTPLQIILMELHFAIYTTKYGLLVVVGSHLYLHYLYNNPPARMLPFATQSPVCGQELIPAEQTLLMTRAFR